MIETGWAACVKHPCQSMTCSGAGVCHKKCDPSWLPQKLNYPTATASAAPSVPPNLYSKLKRWKFVDTKCHSVKLKTLFMIGGHCGQVAGGRGPPPPLTASHDLDSASAMLHSNGHLLLVLLDWTYPLSTTRHHHADGWSFQCATSRHYLVNCSCTVGLCKNGQFRSH